MNVESRIYRAVLGLLLVLGGTACQATSPPISGLPADEPAATVAILTATPAAGPTVLGGDIPTITPGNGQAVTPGNPPTAGAGNLGVPTATSSSAPAAETLAAPPATSSPAPAAPAPPVASAATNEAAPAGVGAGASCASAPLGPASDFNLFILGNLNQSNSATQGRIAAAGDIFLGEYKVGDGLDPATWSDQDVVIAGKNLHFSHGEIFYGNAVYGDNSEVGNNVTIDGELRRGNPVDFSAATRNLHALSTYWAGLPVNGVTQVEYHGQPTARITLTGSDPGLNVFALSGKDLAAANSITVSSPSNSTVIINVDGLEGRMNNFDFSFHGVDRSHVYYNFSQANRLSLSAISVEGNILAPFAAVRFSDGAIAGTMVAASLDGSGQTNLAPPGGCLPWPANAG